MSMKGTSSSSASATGASLKDLFATSQISEGRKSSSSSSKFISQTSISHGGIGVGSGELKPPSVNSNKSSYSGSRRQSHVSHVSVKGRSQKSAGSYAGSRLSKDAESALLAAATTKAEMLCRAKRLKERLALEKEVFELQQRQTLLEIETEVEVQEAKIGVLAGYEEKKSDSVMEADEAQDNVREWLNNNTEPENREYRAQLRFSLDHVQTLNDRNLADNDVVEGVEEVDHSSADKVCSHTSGKVKHDRDDGCVQVKKKAGVVKKVYEDQIECDSVRPLKKEQPLTKQPSGVVQEAECFESTEKHVHDAGDDCCADDVGCEEDDNGGGMKRAHQQLLKKTEKSDSVLTNLATMMMEYQKRSTLPHRNMPRFDGNPLNFHSFIQAFKYGVESKTNDEMDKLYYLEQCTTGEPNRLVKGFMNRDPKIAFDEAKLALTKKFGNKFVIVAAFKEKARKWPEIKREDRKAWSSFSIFLSEFLNTVTDIECLSEVDHSETIKILLAKMPYVIKHQWRLKVCGIEEKDNRIAGFTDFVEFIEKQSIIVNNPVYGEIDSTERRTQNTANKGQKSNTRRTSFATAVGENKDKPGIWCLKCESKSHSLTDCWKFDKLTKQQKSAYCFDKKLCFGCLRTGHSKAKCRNKETCKKCKRVHPTVLHDDRQQATNDRKSETVTTSVGFTDTDKDVSCSTVIPVVVRSKDSGITVTTLALLDNGSNAVFITEKLRSLLNTKGRSVNMRIQTINGDKLTNTSILRNLEVMDVNEHNVIQLPEVYTQESIPANPSDVITQGDIKNWSYLDGVQLTEIPENHVGILIGSNVPKAVEPWEVINSEGNGPYAIRTLLGWTIHGVKKMSDHHRVTVNRIIAQQSLEQQLTKMYNLDFSERLSDDRREKSCEDKQFLDIAARSIEFRDGHYEMALPFRNTNVKMPDNRDMALQRAESLKRRFKKDPTLYEDYKQAMAKVIDKGYAELVANDDGEEGHVWYIPHHGVRHPQKQKLRVVYDCAATYQGTSLNKELLQGPDLTNSLLDVLLRFRQENIGIMADIESMFYQVKVPIEYRDYLRFWWWPDGDIEKPIQSYRMSVHLFGATSSPSCANYALKQTAIDNGNQFSNRVSDILCNNFYVDDCLASIATEREALQLIHDLTSICHSGGFNLTKWTCSSLPIMEKIPESQRSESLKKVDMSEDQNVSSQRALGILWNTETDQFGFKIDIKKKPLTRRGMLSTVCSVYDPLGFAGPAILPARHILQELCKLQQGWDDDVPDMIKERWSKWITSLPELHQLAIDRCWKPAGFGDIKSTQIHHFSDASMSGYGTASYLRLENQKGEVECNLIISKSRVAPLKQVSIPRMELTAATVAVKLDTMLMKTLQLTIDNIIFWCDSQTVLKYIKNNSARHPVFVANRVSVIRDGSSPEQWRYVPTNLNPADHASRGLSVSQLLNKSDWLKGPDFLKQSEDFWPVEDGGCEQVGCEEDFDDDDDITVNVNTVNAENYRNSGMEDDVEGEKLVERLMGHYSDWTRLKRGVAWVLRWKQMLIEGAKCMKPGFSVYLTAEEINQAERAIIAYVQKQSFPDEIKALSKKKGENLSVAKSSKLRKLDPVYTEGLLRVGGRLRYANISDDAKHQLVLPKSHHVTELIIRHVHSKQVLHQGKMHTLSKLRQKYWIVGASSAVKRVISKCVVCRKQRAKVGIQKMADLPACRLQTGEPPFCRTGVDYFGPLLVKVGRTIRKRYGVLFTCLVSRAVHIEVAENMDTSSCISALRRFIARRGEIKELHSDNGSNFVGANKELKQAIRELNQQEIEGFTSNKGIQWYFNAPAASHHGGVWERQIRTVRKILQSIFQTQYLKTCQREEQLHTFLCEVEATINSRPLTRTNPDDPNDLQVLTPNDMLLLRPNHISQPGRFVKTDVYAKNRWRQMQYLANLFWQRWLREYLPDLQQRQKWLYPQRNLSIGDIVLVVDESMPRNTWKMGNVIKIMPDRNGHVRQAEVKTKTTTLVRPISKLCTLLEAED